MCKVKKKKSEVFQENGKVIHKWLETRREGLVLLSTVDRVASGSLSAHEDGQVHTSHCSMGSPCQSHPAALAHLPQG